METGLYLVLQSEYAAALSSRKSFWGSRKNVRPGREQVTLKYQYTPEEFRLISRRILIACWSLLFISTHIPLWFVHVDVPKDSDKLAHFLGYGGLMFCLRGWQWISARLAEGEAANRPRYTLWFAVLLLVAYSVADELLQIPVYRHADVNDAIADWIGMFIGAVSFALARPVIVRLFLASPTRPETATD